MRCAVALGLLLCVAYISAKGNSEPSKPLLGADDVDNKAAEQQPKNDEIEVLKLLGGDDVDKKMGEKTAPEVPEDIKGKLKQDRREFKSLRRQVSSMKSQLHDEALDKKAKKILKKQYSDLKKSLYAKKHEMAALKQLQKEKAATAPKKSRAGKKHKKQGKKGHRGTLIKEDGAGEINSVEQQEAAEKLQKKIARKEERKAERKMNRKHRNKGQTQKSLLDMMKADDEVVVQKKHGRNRNAKSEDGPKLRMLLDIPTRGSERKHKKNKRMQCTDDSNCSNGAKCFTNRKGHKHCRRNGMDKPAGKVCHESEQCARGLQCFVKNPSILIPGKKHKRNKRRGVCMDPTTVDASTGSFMPFNKPEAQS